MTIRADNIRYSAPVLEKARNLLVAQLIEPDGTYPDIWWTWGSNPDRPYRIQYMRNENPELEFITCTCPYGLFAGAGDTRCYHSAAVLMLLEAEESVKRQKLSEVPQVKRTRKPRGAATS